MLAAPGQMFLVKAVASEALEVLAGYFEEVDLLITEGFKQGTQPKIEVVRAALGPELLCRADPALIAVATDAEMDVLSKADSVSAPWEEDIDLRDAARKYYPALNAVFVQANIQRKLEAPDGGFRFALLSSLGLLEVFWIFIGLSGAYSMSVFES